MPPATARARPANLAAYVGRRLGLLAVTLLAISLLVSGIMQLLPGDAAEQVLGAWAERSGKTLDAMRHRVGLDRPWHQQYLEWLGGALRDDLGFRRPARSPRARASPSGRARSRSPSRP